MKKKLPFIFLTILFLIFPILDYAQVFRAGMKIDHTEIEYPNSTHIAGYGIIDTIPITCNEKMYLISYPGPQAFNYYFLEELSSNLSWLIDTSGPGNTKNLAFFNLGDTIAIGNKLMSKKHLWTSIMGVPPQDVQTNLLSSQKKYFCVLNGSFIIWVKYDSYMNQNMVLKIEEFLAQKPYHDTVRICNGSDYNFANGNKVKNIQVDTTIHEILPCGQTGIIDIQVIPTNTIIHQYDTVCNSGTYTFPDGITTSISPNNFFTETTHTSSFVGACCCDSLVITHLHLLPSSSKHEYINVYSNSSYIFPDGSMIESVYHDMDHSNIFTTFQGCDSIIYTHLHELPRKGSYETKFVCKNDSYTFPDGVTINNIMNNITHVSKFTLYNGCDSFINTSIITLPNKQINYSVQLCSGLSYMFPDGSLLVNIESDTTITNSFNTSMGCDSIITTTINIKPPYNTAQTIELCKGSSYQLPDGTTLTDIQSDTTITNSLFSVHGCDSVITTSIQVHSPSQINETVDVCKGSSYLLPNGNTILNIQSDTLYASIFFSQYGCDSVINTLIHVNPAYSNYQAVNVCRGSSFQFPDGITLNDIQSDTTYVSLFSTINDCDSNFTTLVQVKPLYYLNETVEICKGSFFQFPNGFLLTNIQSDTTYVSLLSSKFGCDSTINTSLNLVEIDTGVHESLLKLESNEIDGNYQWINCSSNKPLYNETRRVLTNQNLMDSYQVEITKNGCKDTSHCVEISSFEKAENHLFEYAHIFPNPTTDQLIIETYYLNEIQEISIMDVYGNKVFEKKSLNTKKTFVSVEKLSKGVYWITIKFDELLEKYPFVKM